MNTGILKTTIALMKRETWEHRSFWMVPVSLAGVFLFFFLWAMFYVVPSEVGLELFVDRLGDSDSRALSKVSGIFIPGLSVPFMMVMSFIIAFYLLDSLYSERRDRSILFWKSLPVTDAQTVMSKWLTLFVTIPAYTIATVAVLSLVVTFVVGIAVIVGGGNAWTLVWSNYAFFGGLFSLALIVLTQLLWFVPLFGWLMLASAWAKKAPFLWASLPPFAIVILEEMFLDSQRFLHAVGGRLIPFGNDDDFQNAAVLYDDGESNLRLFGDNVRIEGNFEMVSVNMLGDLLATPAFWTGLVFAGACTVGAVWLRRYRDES